MGKRYFREENFPEDRDDWESGHHEKWRTDHDPETWKTDQEGKPEHRSDGKLSYLLGAEYNEYDGRDDEPEERSEKGRAVRRAGPYKWHYDDTGWYAYVLLDGDQTLRDRAVDELKREGISSPLFGPSYKPADNGKRYRWYVRVGNAEKHPGARAVTAALARVQGFAPDKPEEDLELLRRLQELDTRGRRLRDMLEAEQSKSRGLNAKLAQAEEERRFLVERSSDQYKRLTEAIATLRVENQRLLSRRTEQQEKAEKAPTIQELEAELLKAEAENRAKDEEFSAWLSDQEEFLQVQEEKRKALENKLREQEKEREELAGHLLYLEEQVSDANRERDEIQAEPGRRKSGGKIKRSRIEKAYAESVKCLAPSLGFVNRDSLDALANRFEICEVALALLQKLDSEPREVGWKPVKVTRTWREAADHFRTGNSKGTVDDGRLYFRKQDGAGAHKYLVHIASKSSQKRDFELLRKHDS